MRSGLCLRIPGMQELSPTSSNLRVSSASSSFIKPASPKPSEIKTHHRTVTQSSAYHRIVSNTSIKKLSLPSFLTQSGASKDEILNKIPIGKTLPTQTSDLATDSSSIRTENAKEKHSKKELKHPEEFMKLIFKKKLSKEEILLKVGQYELTRGELQTLEPKSEISRSVIDACLRCIKHKNRKFFKNTEAHDRVFIVDTQMSQTIFTEIKQKWPIFDRNLLKYEYILFPVYIEYWTLAIVDSKMKKLIVYNVEQNNVVQEIFDCLRKFVKRELKIHEKKDIDATGWREIRTEVITIGGVNEYDSGAFSIRLAYKVAVNNKAVASPEVLNDFRYNLLVMLYKHGTQPN